MAEDIIRITSKKRLFAVIIKAKFRQKGLQFFVPDEFSQQLCYMNRPKGYIIGSHIHPPITRRIKSTQEVLFIKSGKIRIDFYDEKRRYIESRIVSPGDIVFLAFGGHGFKFMEEGEMIEVKQGPFLKKACSVKFDSDDKGKMKLKR